MWKMQNKVPASRTLLVYDGSDDQIRAMVDNVGSLQDMYAMKLELLDLHQWDTQPSDNYPNANVAYFVSIDNETFHKKIKSKLVKYDLNRTLLVLLYDQNTLKLADKTINDLRKKREKIEKERKKADRGNRVSNTGRNRVSNDYTKGRLLMAKVRHLRNGDVMDEVLNWFPFLLQLLSGTRTFKTRKEVGVFYRIDPDSDEEFLWYEKQKEVLENAFQVKCACSNSEQLPDDLTIANNAECVVVYVSKNELTDEQKNFTESAKLYKCKLMVVFFEKIDQSYKSTMEEYYKMSLVGNGVLDHWLELFMAMGLINVERHVDLTFYSSRHEDDNYNEHYQPSLERAITQIRPSTSRNDGPTMASISISFTPVTPRTQKLYTFDVASWTQDVNYFYYFTPVTAKGRTQKLYSFDAAFWTHDDNYFYFFDTGHGKETDVENINLEDSLQTRPSSEAIFKPMELLHQQIVESLPTGPERVSCLSYLSCFCARK